MSLLFAFSMRCLFLARESAGDARRKRSCAAPFLSLARSLARLSRLLGSDLYNIIHPTYGHPSDFRARQVRERHSFGGALSLLPSCVRIRSPFRPIKCVARTRPQKVSDVFGRRPTRRAHLSARITRPPSSCKNAFKADFGTHFTLFAGNASRERAHEIYRIIA